jgi:hypothetical protein
VLARQVVLGCIRLHRDEMGVRGQAAGTEMSLLRCPPGAHHEGGS